MIVVEQDRIHITYIWPVTEGKMYLIPVERPMKIGDAFLWKCGDEQYQMVVTSVDLTPERIKVLAVLD